MKQDNTLDQLIETAEVILYLNALYTGILPATTVKLLKSGIKSSDETKLTTGIRRAGIHQEAFERELGVDAEIDLLIEQEQKEIILAGKIEDKKMEAITLYIFLDNNRSWIHPAKTVRFTCFIEELQPMLDRRVVTQEELELVETWVKRASDYRGGIEDKQGRLPMQTQRQPIAA